MTNRTVCRRSRLVLVCSLFLAAAGCSDDNGLTAPDREPIPTNVTTVTALFASYERSLDEKDVDAYMALLEPATPGRSVGYRFYIRDDDAQDFPWLTEDFWSRDVEAAILGNMMDPEFSGEELPVDTIEATFLLLFEKIVDGGRLVLTDAEMRVLVGPDTGWFSDTRFEHLLVSDADGYFRIRSTKEIRKTEPSPFASSSASVEEKSFGAIKGLYRTD